MNRAIAAITAAFLAMPTAPLWAQDGGSAPTSGTTTNEAPDITATKACVDNARTLGTSPNGCLAEAHAQCHRISAETPALVTLCFTTARETWTKATAEQLATLDANAPEALAARARIEAKYDLLSGLLQCDRVEELGRLSEVDPETLLLEKTRCEATASGLSYIRLLWRVSRD